MPSATVIVPIFNGTDYLPAFFASLAEALPDGAQVILVDDGSSEPVWRTVPELPRAEDVIRLRNDTNLGYASAVNRAFALATGDIVVQLNTDLILDVECITAMTSLIERETAVGIVGSKLIYPTTGRVEHVGLAVGNHTKLRLFLDLPADHPLCCRTRELQLVSGATVAMTRRVLETVGPLDERYFNRNEDLEHCLLARRHGLNNFMSAESVAYHWKSASGPARFARITASDALFWSRWGTSCRTDLDGFVDEALQAALARHPLLAETPFEVLDLSRGADQPIVLDRLSHLWPGIESRVHSHRQMNQPGDRLHLPLLTPHWLMSEPTPFIYLVDRHRELAENALWFKRRRQVVRDELIVDLKAGVLTTSELAAG